MAPAADVDLFAPCERDTVLEIRTSKMKTMPGLTIQSGIDKTIRDGRIPVSLTGLQEDEHDPTFHGGRDKAIHGYCCTHYPSWQNEFPEAASRFQPGGFGENFVFARMNERNVCIGDVVSVGSDGLLLQVSLPRQPCFKLNHRFRLKNFAPNTFRLSRTGWYYRVLQPGSVQAGDEARVVERQWPDWTIERVQEYLHRVQDNEAMNERLAAVDALGEESRGSFRHRVAKAAARQRKLAEENKEIWRDYRIVEKKAQTPRITSLTFEAVVRDEDADEWPLLGAHARLRLPNGLIRTYSVVSGNAHRFELGIALDESSRGGSKYLCTETEEGGAIGVGRITVDAMPASMASDHIFIIGGIGITAFLSSIERMLAIHLNCTVHYAVRSASDIPFRERVEAISESLRIYDASKGERMDVSGILHNLGWNSHVYVCGPTKLMNAAKREADDAGLSEEDVHYEAFSADTTGDPFEAEVVGKGLTLKVGEEETLLEVLKKHVPDIPSSCEVGNCGTCKIGLVSGRVDHRGSALTESERETSLLSCVSRGIGKIVIEI